MSTKFWQVYEDPDYYDEESDEGEWQDDSDSVAQKPQNDEFSPYVTVNS